MHLTVVVIYHALGPHSNLSIAANVYTLPKQHWRNIFLGQKAETLCASRSLEKCIERTRICLNPQDHVDQSRPSQSEQDHVQAVLQEADDPSYWVRASQDGNRESHYRGQSLDTSGGTEPSQL